jgi:hypothetical protein
MPAPEKPSTDAGVVFRIAGQAFRIELSATVTDLGNAPGTDVVPIDSAKPPAGETGQ